MEAGKAERDPSKRERDGRRQEREEEEEEGGMMKINKQRWSRMERAERREAERGKKEAFCTLNKFTKSHH